MIAMHKPKNIVAVDRYPHEKMRLNYAERLNAERERLARARNASERVELFKRICKRLFSKQFERAWEVGKITKRGEISKKGVYKWESLPYLTCAEREIYARASRLLWVVKLHELTDLLAEQIRREFAETYSAKIWAKNRGIE